MRNHYGCRSCDILAQQPYELLEQHTSGYSRFVEELQCTFERLEQQPEMIFKLVEINLAIKYFHTFVTTGATYLAMTG